MSDLFILKERGERCCVNGVTDSLFCSELLMVTHLESERKRERRVNNNWFILIPPMRVNHVESYYCLVSISHGIHHLAKRPPRLFELQGLNCRIDSIVGLYGTQSRIFDAAWLTYNNPYINTNVSPVFRHLASTLHASHWRGKWNLNNLFFLPTNTLLVYLFI